MIIAYDIGSTGCKTCIYTIGEKVTLAASSLHEYSFRKLPNGGVEQDPEDWWNAMKVTTMKVLSGAGIDPDAIRGISFCAQMQGLVLVDRDLKVLRPAMSYMDQRGGRQKEAVFGRGPKIEGINVCALLKSLRINGAVAASVKDPVWKYKWVAEHEPDIFNTVFKWLDVKDYLIARATGECTMTEDSAFATFLTDQRKGGTKWSDALVSMYGVRKEHLPRIIRSFDRAGELTDAAASELGLAPGTPVFGGGGDASMMAIGAGATVEGDAYVYTGTSGWISTTVTRRKVDVFRKIASIVGAQPGVYNFFAEQETAGKCLEWVRDHLALDEINLYLDQKHVLDDPECRYRSLYDFLIESIESVPPGSGGVIFTPWLHGNRSPFEDANARGIFFNLGLDTGKRMMIRAVVEGIIFHQKWLFESVRRSFPVNLPLRFTGGGAMSPVVARILADILECPVQTVENPQNCGTSGAALTAALGLGIIDTFTRMKEYIPVTHTYEPHPGNFPVYRKQYAAFRKLYPANRRLFTMLNSTGG